MAGPVAAADAAGDAARAAHVPGLPQGKLNQADSTETDQDWLTVIVGTCNVAHQELETSTACSRALHSPVTGS